MRISIIGTGYVGSVTGACLAALGNKVVFVDVDRRKIEAILAGKPLIFEPGLGKLLTKHRKLVSATTSFEEAVRQTDVSFICVGTPSRKDGSMDLSYVKAATGQLAKAIAKKKSFHTVVVKSTVVPGTTEMVGRIMRKRVRNFGLAMNPEFLREGRAVKDFLRPDRIVIGSADARSKAVMNRIYRSFACPVLQTDLRTAELIKYASNAFLALKISFANTIANAGEKLGVGDVLDVMKGIGFDHRISPHFLHAGLGYGGSCFPKDVAALVTAVKRNRYRPRLLEAAVSVNAHQPLRAIELAEKIAPLRGKTAAVLGITFKPNTDDVREAPSLKIVKALLKKGARVRVYDPKAAKVFGDAVEYSTSVHQCIRGSHVVFLVTEWDEFRKIKPGMLKRLMKAPRIVVDGRRLWDPEKFRKAGLKYQGIGFGGNL